MELLASDYLFVLDDDQPHAYSSHQKSCFEWIEEELQVWIQIGWGFHNIKDLAFCIFLLLAKTTWWTTTSRRTLVTNCVLGGTDILDQLVQNEERKHQQLAQLLILSNLKLFIYGYLLYHQIVFLVVVQILLCWLQKLRKERVNIINDNSLLGDELLRAILTQLEVGVWDVDVLSLFHALDDLLHK